LIRFRGPIYKVHSCLTNFP